MFKFTELSTPTTFGTVLGVVENTTGIYALIADFVGDNGRIFKTVDQGENWALVDSFSNAPVGWSIAKYGTTTEYVVEVNLGGGNRQMARCNDDFTIINLGVAFVSALDPMLNGVNRNVVEFQDVTTNAAGIAYGAVGVDGRYKVAIHLVDQDGPEILIDLCEAQALATQINVANILDKNFLVAIVANTNPGGDEGIYSIDTSNAYAVTKFCGIPTVFTGGEEYLIAACPQNTTSDIRFFVSGVDGNLTGSESTLCTRTFTDAQLLIPLGPFGFLWDVISSGTGNNFDDLRSAFYIINSQFENVAIIAKQKAPVDINGNFTYTYTVYKCYGAEDSVDSIYFFDKPASITTPFNQIGNCATHLMGNSGPIIVNAQGEGSAAVKFGYFARSTLQSFAQNRNDEFPRVLNFGAVFGNGEPLAYIPQRLNADGELLVKDAGLNAALDQFTFNAGNDLNVNVVSGLLNTHNVVTVNGTDYDVNWPYEKSLVLNAAVSGTYWFDAWILNTGKWLSCYAFIKSAGLGGAYTATVSLYRTYMANANLPGVSAVDELLIVSLAATPIAAAGMYGAGQTNLQGVHRYSLKVVLAGVVGFDNLTVYLAHTS